LSEKISCPKCGLNLNSQTEIGKNINDIADQTSVNTISEVDSKEWETKILKSKKLVLVEFWHQNCPACKAFAPIFNNKAIEFKDKIKFLKFDVLKNKENRDLAIKYGLTSTPTLIFFCDGKKIATKEDREGYETEEQFRSLLNSMIKKCL
jgi:thiol-disulfide isomerase/thioredoxin